MPEYSIGLFETGTAKESNFQEFISIVSGRSIISAADWGAERFELGLSGDLMIRFFRLTDGLNINLVSTTNPGEIPPVALALGSMPKRVTALMLEKKLRGLRTLYAISYLLASERVSELESYLSRHPYGDIERALLNEEEQLYIESISYGSWILTIWTTTKEAYKALVLVIGFIYERGRESLLHKMEAEARLKEAEAKRQEVAIERDTFELLKDKTNFLLELRDKVKHPGIRENLDSCIIRAADDLVQGDLYDSDASKGLQKRLPPPRGE